MTDAMTKAYRISLGSALALLIAVAAFLIYHLLGVRPILFDDNGRKAILQVTNSPATTADQLRGLVLSGEQVLTQAFVVVDRAVVLLVVLGCAASFILFTVALLLKRPRDGA